MRQCCKAMVNNSLIQPRAFPLVIAFLFHFRVEYESLAQWRKATILD
jgi:hypothetical protein